MINVKNVEETKKKVEEIKKKRKPVEGTTKVRKNQKKKADKKSKFMKFMWKFIAVEYAIFGLIVITNNYIDLTNENAVKSQIIQDQQRTINEMAKLYSENIEPLYSGDKIQIIHSTFQAPNNVFTISKADRELMAKLLYHEARGESYECQKAVVSVILNRLQSGTWGNTISSVIYATNQFEPVAKGLLKNTKPMQTQYDAIDDVLKNGTTLPQWVQYFRAGYHFGWKGYQQYTSIDNTFFGGF